MSASLSRRIALAWLPAVAYTLLIWWVSSQALHVPFMARVPLQDKGVHALEYGLLGALLFHAVATTWQQRGPAAVVVAMVITTGLGLLDEVHQAFVPGRMSDALDLLADSIGALIGSAGLALVLHLRARRRESASTRRAAPDGTPRPN